MKVSIIVPVYNVKEYLEKCLNSLVEQTLREIEIFLVDDGSSDGSAEILQKYKETYPDKIFVITKKNEGQATARNVALKRISGEYVGFVDSDDWIDKDMYERMYSEAIKNQSDIVICDMIDHYENYQIYHNSSDFTNRFTVTPSACNKLFKRTLIGQDEFPKGLWYEDFEFTTKQLMKTEQISVIHKGFYHCHCRSISTMNNNNSQKNLDILVVLDHLKKYVEDNDWETKYGNTLEYLVLDHVLITSINRVAKQKNKQKNETIRKMRAYVLKYYPKFYQDEVYKKMKRNRKIVAYLNSKGLHQLVRFILEIKKKVKSISRN